MVRRKWSFMGRKEIIKGLSLGKKWFTEVSQGQIRSYFWVIKTDMEEEAENKVKKKCSQVGDSNEMLGEK